MTDPALALLAEFESLPTSSKPVALSRDMPPLLRVQAVRVSTGSAPEELVPVFNSDQPTLRDLACLVAIERFTAPQCRALAATLLGSFHNSERMAGAMLAGLTDESRDDEELLARLRRRAESPGSWIVQQHCYIALAMLDRPVPGFDPLPLLQHRAMPRTTLNMALMHTGRLEGLDWLLSPFGDPPVGGVEGLRLLLDYLRYDHVLRRYLPELPPFSLWADPAMQRLQVEWIRDWYLVHRPGLRFDARSRTFRGAGDG